jgi:hypothetical protein
LVNVNAGLLGASEQDNRVILANGGQVMWPNIENPQIVYQKVPAKAGYYNISVKVGASWVRSQFSASAYGDARGLANLWKTKFDKLLIVPSASRATEASELEGPGGEADPSSYAVGAKLLSNQNDFHDRIGVDMAREVVSFNAEMLNAGNKRNRNLLAAGGEIMWPTVSDPQIVLQKVPGKAGYYNVSVRVGTAWVRTQFSAAARGDSRGIANLWQTKFDKLLLTPSTARESTRSEPDPSISVPEEINYAASAKLLSNQDEFHDRIGAAKAAELVKVNKYLLNQGNKKIRERLASGRQAMWPTTNNPSIVFQQVPNKKGFYIVSIKVGTQWFRTQFSAAAPGDQRGLANLWRTKFDRLLP